MIVLPIQKTKTTDTRRVAYLLWTFCLMTMLPLCSFAGQEQFSLTNTSPLLFNDPGTTPVVGRIQGFTYQVIQGHAIAEGDMVLGKVFADGNLELPISKRGLGQNQAIDRWVDGIVPYQFAENITDAQRLHAIDAVTHWNDRSRVSLIERTPENEDKYTDFITFEPSMGCASWVGKIGLEQAVWVSDSCTVGSVVHEIGHAIGLFHEHTRADRDSYIQVHWDNITTDRDFNFDVMSAGATLYDTYDYGSIMHYGEYFFSANNQRTIVAPDDIQIGQRIALSEADITSVNLMYSTDLALQTSPLSTDNGVEIDVAVTNLGNLGSHQLTLIASIGDDADWISISSQSGWVCQAYNAELRCLRDTLSENSSSQFNLLVDPKSGSIADFSARLESRTLDTDLSNNIFNDSIAPTTNTPINTTVLDQLQPEPGTTEAESSTSSGSSEAGMTAQLPDNTGNVDGNGVSSSGTNPLELAAAVAEPLPQSSSNTSTDEGGSGGGAAGWLILACLTYTNRRRFQLGIR